MSHTQVLKISAVVMALFGIALLLMPNTLVTAYKAEAMNGPGIYNSMLYGAVLIAFAVMNWSASSLTSAETRVIVLGNLVGNVLGLGSALYRQLTDPSVATAAWINVLIFLVFTVLFAQLYLRMRSGAGAMPGARMS
jgi:hypothetical protein